jgi:HemX protein
LADRTYFALAVTIYGISTIYSIFLWRRGFRKDERVTYLLLAGAFVFHTVAMFKRGFSLSRCPVNNLYEATTFVAWSIVAAYLVIGAWPRVRFFGAFASPGLFAIGVFALWPGMDKHGAKPIFTGGLVSLHATLILLSYGAFALSSIAAVMYLKEEHDLKFHKTRAVVSMFPSIERLERITARLLTAGFVLLTVGLALAPFLMKERFGVFLKDDAKILWSCFIWVLYAGLLAMRWLFSQRGRRFALGTVGSSSFLLLTFWGVNLLSKIHHP